MVDLKFIKKNTLIAFFVAWFLVSFTVSLAILTQLLFPVWVSLAVTIIVGMGLGVIAIPLAFRTAGVD